MFSGVNSDDGMKMSFMYIFSTNCCRGLLVHRLFLNIIAPSSLIHPLIIFHCPLAGLNIVCFPSQDPLYCPQMVNFSRSLEKC
jgi:hypothetical protein